MKATLSFIIFCIWITISLGQTPGEWVWLKGSNAPNDTGSWGIQGVPSPTNNPPAVYEPCEWTDRDGNFWIFGGIGYPQKVFAALWKYNPLTNEWTWMKGPNDTICYPGSWGLQGVPSPTNNPPTSIFVAASWVDTTGDLWMFEGGGCLPSWGGCDWNTMWRYHIATNEWTWMKGPDTINDNGHYGTMGVPDTANCPQSTSECAAAWVDNQNNLWMFGGTGLDALWKYDISTNTWTWMKGTYTWNSPGIYGSLGVEDSLNNPGGRGSYSRWKDGNGNLWLFGGSIYNSTSAYGDLWRFNISTNNWTWMHGSNTVNSGTSYIDHCKFSPQNYPSSRIESRACWKDISGSFWLFGGGRYYNSMYNSYNDLWKYCPQLNQWAIIEGTGQPNVAGYWGTQGVSSPLNHPNGRFGSVAWTENNNLYFFGGWGIGGRYNDLWRYTIDSTCVECPQISTEIESISIHESFLTIIPNPARGYLTIQSAMENGMLEIFNAHGEKIYSAILNEPEKEIELKNAAAGIYFLKVSDGEKTYTQKLVIE